MAGSTRHLPAWHSLAMGRRGAVVSHHPLATQAGLDVLSGGGNAFDAAIAVASTLTVVEPQASGIGGDGLYCLFRAEDGGATVVQSLSPAPHGQRGEGAAPCGDPHAASAAATPAVAAGWSHIAARYGTQPVHALFEAAVHYARDGYPASRSLCAQIAEHRDVIERDGGCAATYLVDGDAPHPGATLRNRALARTLEVLGEAGGWDPECEPIQNLARFCQEQGGGITRADLVETHAVERRPIAVQYGELTVLSAPPPSMGLLFLLELNVLEAFGMQRVGHLSADAIHLMVEAKKLAFAEWEKSATGPAAEGVLEGLLSKDLARGLAVRLDPRRRTPPPGTVSIPGATSYFCIVDESGNAVSAIQSLADPFGACLLDPRSGILLGNRLMAGPQQGGSLGPAGSVRQTMNTPMVLKEGGVRAVLGTPGGDGQYQAALQVFTGLFDWGLDPQQAVQAPRWSHFQPSTGSALAPEQAPDVLLLESRIEEHVVLELKRRGHRVATVGPEEDPYTASLILRDKTGVLIAGADPRRDGWAGVF